jgi:hypothetical protein
MASQDDPEAGRKKVAAEPAGAPVTAESETGPAESGPAQPISGVRGIGASTERAPTAVTDASQTRWLMSFPRISSPDRRPASQPAESAEEAAADDEAGRVAAGETPRRSSSAAHRERRDRGGRRYVHRGFCDRSGSLTRRSAQGDAPANGDRGAARRRRRGERPAQSRDPTDTCSE